MSVEVRNDGYPRATSDCLGQNFAEMFNIKFEDNKGQRCMVWPNRYAPMTYWGACLFYRICSYDMRGILDACINTVKTLNEAGFRAAEDLRENYPPRWKYSYLEMKGVPVRIEIVPKDMAKNQDHVVQHDNSSKMDIPTSDLVERGNDILDNIQQSMFDAARQKRDACIKVAYTWEEFITALNEKKLILAPWCDEEEVEKKVKAHTKAEMGACKTLCTPLDQPDLAEGMPAKKWTYWGRSY
ncbi:hypothetical protein AQUCO_00800138v1 [Aquilegia coerulea]|uniref:proline--tRNA ligase n=1 Tax=Aquilegia coerulea TaxID=218851 RepID=A0A2G5EHM8_AQUCA|nr:hypothetical protein AQUCO_00800138v1 [Aquilegia coerulea]